MNAFCCNIWQNLPHGPVSVRETLFSAVPLSSWGKWKEITNASHPMLLWRVCLDANPLAIPGHLSILVWQWVPFIVFKGSCTCNISAKEFWCRTMTSSAAQCINSGRYKSRASVNAHTKSRTKTLAISATLTLVPDGLLGAFRKRLTSWDFYA